MKISSYIVVHEDRLTDCPKLAFECDKDIADRIKEDPICMACGGKLEVVERHYS